MRKLEFKPQDRQSIDFAEQERIRFENNGKKDRAVVDASNLSEENKESWQKSVSLIKGAMCRKLSEDKYIDGTADTIKYDVEIGAIGNGLTYSNGKFVVGKGIKAIKFCFTHAFFNMTKVAYLMTKIYKNGEFVNDTNIWTFFDSGLSGSGGGVIMIPCSNGDEFTIIEQTTNGSNGYLNNNSFIQVEVF
jgi:hypothetical protein